MMLKSIRCLVVVLVPFALGLLLSACSSGGPEAAAQKGFEEWTKNISVAYRNVSYRTVSSKEAFATVEVTGEFQNAPNTPWVEQQAAVQVVKQGDQWRPPTQFVFAPSPRAVQTAQAISNATATVESARASATQAAFEQVRQATATAAIQAAQATATAVTQAAQATATAATQAAQAAAAAATRATATAVASDRQKAAGANGDFNGSSLPPEWNVLRPDPNRWRLDQGALVVMPAPEIEWNRWYNTFIRPLPTLNSDLDITIKLQVTEKNVDRQFFWMRLQAGEETQNGPWMDVAVSLARSGSSVYSKTNSGGGQKQVNTPLDGDTYLRISRRKGKNYATYFSSDAKSWTYVNEWNNAPAFDRLVLAGSAAPKVNSPINVYWVHFEVPDPDPVAVVSPPTVPVAAPPPPPGPMQSASSVPVFVYPQNGQTLDLNGSYMFKINPVPGASGYLWGFKRNGELVWENLRDEGKMSGVEYNIHTGTTGHDKLGPGPIEVWVRAMIDGKWGEARTITINLR